jgi:hypothetical protein
MVISCSEIHQTGADTKLVVIGKKKNKHHAEHKHKKHCCSMHATKHK